MVTERTSEKDQSEKRAWYAIHTYSGYENKVRSHLEARIASMDMRNKIFRVIVPMEEEVEIKGGQRRTVQSITHRHIPGCGDQVHADPGLQRSAMGRQAALPGAGHGHRQAPR